MTSYCVKDQWRDFYLLVSKRLERPQTVEFSFLGAPMTCDQRFLRLQEATQESFDSAGHFSGKGPVPTVVASRIPDRVVTVSFALWYENKYHVGAHLYHRFHCGPHISSWHNSPF